MQRLLRPLPRPLLNYLPKCPRETLSPSRPTRTPPAMAHQPLCQILHYPPHHHISAVISLPTRLTLVPSAPALRLLRGRARHACVRVCVHLSSGTKTRARGAVKCLAATYTTYLPTSPRLTNAPILSFVRLPIHWTAITHPQKFKVQMVVAKGHSTHTH